MEAHKERERGRAIEKEWEMKTNCTIECKQVTGRTSHIYFDLLSLSLNKNYNGWRRHRCFTLIWPQYHTEISILLQKIGIVGIHMYVRSRTHKVHVHVWAMPYHAIPCHSTIAFYCHNGNVAMPFNSTGSKKMLSAYDAVFYFLVVWKYFG